jgi:hypothetical protein
MAFAKHPSQPPPFDASAFSERLRQIADKVGLGPFDALADKRLPKLMRWIRSDAEYDGADAGGLRDVVDANAYALDDLKGDFDGHRVLDNQRHSSLASRVSALEAQGEAPFPMS